MSKETQANLEPEQPDDAQQAKALETLRDPVQWERMLQAVGAEDARQAKDVQELRALCRRMATRMEDMERRLRRLEADG